MQLQNLTQRHTELKLARNRTKTFIEMNQNEKGAISSKIEEFKQKVRLLAAEIEDITQKIAPKRLKYQKIKGERVE